MNENNTDRPLQLVPGGEYDSMGFYYIPDGSFWDPDGVYFNKDGLDRHGGYYDEKLEYHPGQGWIDELMCYEDEKEGILGSNRIKLGRQMNRGEDEEENDEIDIDQLYEEVDYAKILQEEERKHNIKHETVDHTEPQRENIHFHPKYKSNTQIKNENTFNNNNPIKEVISPDLLFNKIPDNLQQNTKTHVEVGTAQSTQRMEKHIEVDSLFN